MTYNLGIFDILLVRCPFLSWYFTPNDAIFKNKTNIFKAPEVPKKIVPEEKVREAVPKKPEVPPAKGIHWY